MSFFQFRDRHFSAIDWIGTTHPITRLSISFFDDIISSNRRNSFLEDENHFAYVISRPPLSAGGVHESVTLDLVTFLIARGPRGFDGGPRTITSHSAVSVPVLFIKRIEYRPVSARTALVITNLANLLVSVICVRSSGVSTLKRGEDNEEIQCLR